MTSPPGTWQSVTAAPDGSTCSLTIYFDTTTLAIHNVGSPPAALVCDNQTGRVCPVTYTGPSGVQSINAPVGITRLSAAALASQGFTTRDDLQGISVAVPAAR